MLTVLLGTVFSESFFTALSVTAPSEELVEEILALAEGTGLAGRLLYRIVGAELRVTKQDSCLFRTESIATWYVRLLERRYCRGFMRSLEEGIAATCNAARLPGEDQGLKDMLYLSQIVQLIEEILEQVRKTLFEQTLFEGDVISMKSLLSAIAFLTDTHMASGSRSALVNTLFLRCVCPLILKQVAGATSDSESDAPELNKPRKNSLLYKFKHLGSSAGKEIKEKPSGPVGPSKRASLMTLSKAMQSLANGTSLGEDSLEGLESHVELIRPKLTALLDDICKCEFEPNLGLSTDCTLPFDKQVDHLGNILAIIQGKIFGIKATLRKLGMHDTLHELRTITKTLQSLLKHPAPDEDIFRALFQKSPAQAKLHSPGGGLYGSVPENLGHAIGLHEFGPLDEDVAARSISSDSHCCARRVSLSKSLCHVPAALSLSLDTDHQAHNQPRLKSQHGSRKLPRIKSSRTFSQ